MSIKKILVPTDFSDCSEEAVRVALLLARRTDAEIYFLHLYIDPIGDLHVPKYAGPTHYSDPEIGHVKSQLDKLVKRAQGDGVEAKSVLVYDKGIDTIEDYADSYGVDLIVMGSHGANGMIGWLAGCNAERVSKNSDIPVLVIKKHFESQEIKNILFASSFEENVLVPLMYITELASIWNATVHLLYINLSIHTIKLEDARQQMEDMVAKFPDTRFTINFGETNDEELAVTSMAKKLGVDLITMTPHDRDGLIRIFSNSIAEKLVRHEELPVLVLPDSDN